MINDSDVSTGENADDVQVTEVTAEVPEKEPVITNREAMQKAIEKHRPEVEFKRSEKTELKDKEPGKTVPDAELETPLGFNKEEEKAWKAKDYSGIQKAFRRVHEAKTQEMSRAQTEAKQAREEAQKAREEAKSWQDIDVIAKPFIEDAMKRGQTRAQAVANAFGLIDALKNADPQKAKAELKQAGIDFDKAPETKTAEIPKELQDKIDALQKWKDDSESQIEEQKGKEVLSKYETAYTNLSSLKNRTGEAWLPDLLDNSEEAARLHQRIGSLTKNPDFIEGVLTRFPNADFNVMVHQAYIQSGGTINGELVKAPINNTQEIERKKRAAASSPGKPAARIDASSLKGKLSTRAAMKKAIEIHGWEN